MTKFLKISFFVMLFAFFASCEKDEQETAIQIVNNISDTVSYSLNEASIQKIEPNQDLYFNTLEIGSYSAKFIFPDWNTKVLDFELKENRLIKLTIFKSEDNVIAVKAEEFD